MTAGTAVGSLPERHRLSMMTAATVLGRIGRVDFDHHSASFFRFAGELPKERRPRRVTDALGQTMGVKHPAHMQVFHTDHPEAVHDLAARLMGKVVASERNALMDPRHGLTVLATLWSAFGQGSMFALDFRQGFLFLTEEAWVLDLLRRREGGKGFESDIDADWFGSLKQAFSFTLHRETDGPLARAAASNGTRFDAPFERAVIDHLDRAELREADPLVMGDAEAALREGERVIAVGSPEAWIAGLLACFQAAKERLHRLLDAHGHVLQDLGMHSLQAGTFDFEHGEGLLLLREREAFALLLIGSGAHFQQMIIEPPALSKGLVELLDLLLGGIEPVFEGFTHRGSIAEKDCMSSETALWRWAFVFECPPGYSILLHPGHQTRNAHSSLPGKDAAF